MRGKFIKNRKVIVSSAKHYLPNLLILSTRSGILSKFNIQGDLLKHAILSSKYIESKLLIEASSKNDSFFETVFHKFLNFYLILVSTIESNTS